MIESELSERFAVLTDTADDADWLAVVRRARELGRPRRARPALLVAAALAVAILVVTPAIALRGHIVRLFDDAPRAPERVAKSFAELDVGVPPRLQSGVVAAEARKVLETPVGSNETASLWLAPRRQGGFCTLTELDGRGGARRGAGGECTPLLDELSLDSSLHGHVSPDGVILSGPVLLHGWVRLSKADSLEVGFEDGSRAVIPFVWVSKPVDTGFFVYSVPSLHWQVGHLPTRLTVRDATGNEIADRDVSGIDLRKAQTQP
jgi:hypothetical protein